MIKWGTLDSKINSDIRQDIFDTNIRAYRTALWLREDCLVALAFHTLDGPTAKKSGKGELRPLSKVPRERRN